MDNKYSSFDFYKENLKEFKLPTRDEEYELFKKYKNGDKSLKSIIIEKYLPLIILIVKRSSFLNVEKDDLISESVLLLDKYIDKYDITKGNSFITYINSILPLKLGNIICEKYSYIKFDKYIFPKIKEINIYINDFYSKNNYYPSINDVAKEVKMTHESVLSLLNCKDGPISLNMPLHNSNNNSEPSMEVSEFITDHNKNVLEDVLQSDLKYLIKKLMSNKKLSERDYFILTYRFGLDNGIILTQREIAKIFHVSAQCIQRRENVLIKNLRTKALELGMEEYLDKPVFTRIKYRKVLEKKEKLSK